MFVPRFVVVMIVIALALGLAYLLNHLLGLQYDYLADFVDLDGEANLPTWYASIEWFGVAAVFWLFAARHVARSDIRSWFLLLLPAVFLALSVDEVAGSHDYLGVLADRLLPNGTREDTLVPQTGLWFLVVGVPFAVGFATLIGAVFPYLASSPRAFIKLITGMACFLIGAIGIEALSNFVVEGSIQGVGLVLSEELAEMIGATIVLWGGYELISDPVERGHPAPSSLSRSGPP